MDNKNNQERNLTMVSFSTMHIDDYDITKYVTVEFPEFKHFMGRNGVYLICGKSSPDDSYAVPVDMFREWLYNK